MFWKSFLFVGIRLFLLTLFNISNCKCLDRSRNVILMNANLSLLLLTFTYIFLQQLIREQRNNYNLHYNIRSSELLLRSYFYWKICIKIIVST